MMGYLHASFEKLLDIDCKFSGFTYINYGAYVRNQDFFAFVNKVQDKVKNTPEFIRWVIKRNYEQCKRLLGTVEIDTSKLKKKQNKELKSLLERYINEFHNMGPFWAVPFAVEKIGTSIVTEELKYKLGEKNKDGFKDYFLTLTSPSKEGYVGQEQREFLQLAIEIEELGYSLDSPRLKTVVKEKKKLMDKINSYVSNYAWLNLQYMIGSPWTIEDFFLRLRHISNPEKKLKEQQKGKVETEQEVQKIIKKLNLSKKAVSIINAVREYVFLRTYRKDVTTIGDYKIRPLLTEIGNRFGFSFEEMTYHLVEEIYDLLLIGKKIGKTVIKKRMNDFAILADEKSVEVIVKKALQDYKEAWGEEIVEEEVREFQGEVACKGYGKGKVRNLIDRRLIASFQQGEILVTTMTTPDFVPAMQKAAAIVTDEGGILCHAAIISRELNKPCVIGTEIATKVLKTGDVAEVDAEQGIIRKLENE
ncbi:hypothetical protein ISS85_00920 [Candidatus Microgenomates bacterium]|nr:hypothetical protein [Candidatus Microgenomates bacterium]